MRVLFFFALSIISVSYVKSDSLPCVICAYQGSNGNGSFKLEDVPDRCEVVLYGGNYFNVEPAQADTAAITALKKAGKPVYMLYIYDKGYAGQNLYQIVFPNNTHKLDEYMAPMISYLKNNKIDGVLFGFLSMTGGVIPCYDVKINEFVCKIKKLVPSIKVGLMLPGWECDEWVKHDVFDFTVTNANVDFYMIDSSMSGDNCYANTTSTGGRTPITTLKPRVASLTNVSMSTTASGMNLTKVMVNVMVLATQTDSSDGGLRSYSQYCRRGPKEIWCGDTIQLMYDQAVFLKKVFKGIMMSYLDTDDMDNTCKCGKYPVTNNYIDAWEKQPVKCCDAIS